MGSPLQVGRRMSFDFGQKRIGIATSDRESILVSPHVTILNDEKLSEKLQEIIQEVTPIYIVVGDPKHLSGFEGSKSDEANSFGLFLKSFYDGPIYFVDERMSTSNAYSQMRQVGKSEKDVKHVIDQISAINILESALLNEKSGIAVGRLL